MRLKETTLLPFSSPVHIFCFKLQLTGLWVFYENEDDKVVHRKVSSGKRPKIDPRLKNRSTVERKLTKIMKQCWESEPAKRPDIFQVVRQLRRALSEESVHKGVVH